MASASTAQTTRLSVLKLLVPFPIRSNSQQIVFMICMPNSVRKRYVIRLRGRNGHRFLRTTAPHDRTTVIAKDIARRETSIIVLTCEFRTAVNLEGHWCGWLCKAWIECDVVIYCARKVAQRGLNAAPMELHKSVQYGTKTSGGIMRSGFVPPAKYRRSPTRYRYLEFVSRIKVSASSGGRRYFLSSDGVERS